MPEFNPLANELGFDFKDVSAACLHMAHWASTLFEKTKDNANIKINTKILFETNFMWLQS